LLTAEERALLEDWEFVLCDMFTLETVAFLPRLQRCLERVDVLLTEREDAMKKIGAQNLQLALGSRHMLQFPMSTFSRVLFERYRDRFSAEQCAAMSVWEAKLCKGNAEDIARAARSRAEALIRVQQFLAHFAAKIGQLKKPILRDVVMSKQKHDHAAWIHARDFYVRHVPFLTVEEKELLEDWELVLCDSSLLDAVVFLPRVQRCFGRVQTFIDEHREELRQQNKQGLVSMLQSTDTESHPMSVFCAFLSADIGTVCRRSKMHRWRCGNVIYVYPRRSRWTDF
jgi:hypothetical protein